VGRMHYPTQRWSQRSAVGWIVVLGRARHPKRRVGLYEGRLLELPTVANSRGEGSADGAPLPTAVLPRQTPTRIRNRYGALRAGSGVGTAGFEPATPAV
jgi:hypothetical protein